jgi:hypothetical protein
MCVCTAPSIFAAKSKARIRSAIKKFIVARKLSPVREHISIQQSRTRGIIEPLSNLPECEPRGIY